VSDKDGGPAFPSLEIYEGYNRDRDRYEVQSDSATGMSLRDYFAAQALSGWFSGTSNLPNDANLGLYAESFYKMADAMIAERVK